MLSDAPEPHASETNILVPAVEFDLNPLVVKFLWLSDE